MRIGRFVRMRAEPGQGTAVEELMLRVARGLGAVPGCELYVVHRSATEPDTIWVSESWASQEALEGSVNAVPTEGPEGSGAVSPAQVLGLLTGPPEVIALTPLGGVGLPPG